MNDRIKKIRKLSGLSMEQFGKKIGITKASVSRIESGENNPSEQTVILICKEFNINEQWLRSGTGEMHTSISDNERYAINVGKLQRTNNETLIRWVNRIAETDPERLKQIEELLKSLLNIE